jgi:hypothetical protein
MIKENQKTSLLVTQQLPEFVRDNPDYANFSLFLQAYYEWMEQTGQVTEASKNLLSYKDIDDTTDQFLEYFTNDFLPNFPQDSLISKNQAIKVAKELYRTKGTPASYQFLFRILYNSDFEYFYTRDAVFKASDGIWYVSKSLKLSTTDTNFLDIKNLRLFGETTKSIATVENSVLVGSKIDVYISDIQRLFQSGEFVRVVDTNNNDVLFDGETLRAKVVGQVSQLRIDPQNRGLLYKVGDPVIVYGGINSENGVEAVAEVETATSGSIQSIGVLAQGFGYTNDPNTKINIISTGTGANAAVGSLDPNYRGQANVTSLPIDSITNAQSITIGNTSYSFFSNLPSANANTTLANAFSFTSFTTYPIASVLVRNGGGGFTSLPTIKAISTYETSDETYSDLSKIGILAPIQIQNGGQGYVANDKIIIAGGSGYGAFANVRTVAANGAITNVHFVSDSTQPYPLGGMGYKLTNLPTVSVQSANNSATGAILYAPGVLGDGAEFSVVVDRAGSITKIKLISGGEDYVSTPNVSLKVQDIVVSNVSVINLPRKGDVIYQGANINVSTYKATVNSISLLQPFNDPSQSLYSIRVFEYNSNPNPTQPLIINRNINYVMANTAYDATYNQYGYKNYGDGTAKATASFLNGLVLGQGQYVNAQGQPSSFSVLQSDDYNNYTYQITVEKEIEKYRTVLLNLLHPSGMKVVGRMSAKISLDYDYTTQDALYSGRPLYASEGGIGTSGATATIVADFDNKSNNIVKFSNLAGANIAEIIFAGTTTLSLEPTHGPSIMSEVISVNHQSDTVTVSSNVWLTYANVATVTANAGSNAINITSLTGAYDIMNNGVYSNTAYPLKDIVYTGDKVLIANNTQKTVKSVDYANGIIYLTSDLSNIANSYLSVNRTFVANSSLSSDQIRIYGPVGTTYIPVLTTEDGQIIVTEDDRIILLG